MKALRIVSLLVVFTLLAATLAGCAGGQKTVKIAILAPITGDVATFGASTRDGAILAFEEWNAKGGVNGAKIEWVVGDSRCDPVEARNAANKVIDQDKVKFIVGEVCSSASIPVSEVANEKKVLQISPTSTNPAVTVNPDGSTKKYTFRACFIDPFQGKVMAKFALEQLGAKTAAVVLDQGNDYIRGLAEFFRDAFEAGGVFFIPTYYEKASLIGAQAKQAGVTAVMLGGDGWDSPDLDRSAVDGGFFSNHYSGDDPRPVVQEWKAKYKAKYGSEPDALATLAYDAANILLTAMKNAGSFDVDKVVAAMEKIEFEGVSGKITFDAQHNPVKSAVVLQVKDGKVTYKMTVNP
jgi:branched-chain amino acid transport system substrate-binding protein